MCWIKSCIFEGKAVWSGVSGKRFGHSTIFPYPYWTLAVPTTVNHCNKGLHLFGKFLKLAKKWSLFRTSLRSKCLNDLTTQHERKSRIENCIDFTLALHLISLSGATYWHRRLALQRRRVTVVKWHASSTATVPSDILALHNRREHQPKAPQAGFANYHPLASIFENFPQCCLMLTCRNVHTMHISVCT